MQCPDPDIACVSLPANLDEDRLDLLDGACALQSLVELVDIHISLYLHVRLRARGPHLPTTRTHLQRLGQKVQQLLIQVRHGGPLATQVNRNGSSAIGGLQRHAMVPDCLRKP